MPYATTPAMIERYTERALVDLTDRAEPYTGAIVAAVLERAQAGADGEIDAALRGRYALPLAEPVPGLIADIACVLTWWWLWPEPEPDGAVTRRADWARDQLRRLARGELVLEAPAASAPSGGAGVLIDAGPRVFTRDTLRGY